MSKHTPGPWYAGKDWLSMMICNADGFPVAEAKVSYVKRSLEEAEANARLIEAAPELLEALRLAVGRQGFSNDELISARAAIAKATGEQQ